MPAIVHRNQGNPCGVAGATLLMQCGEVGGDCVNVSPNEGPRSEAR